MPVELEELDLLDLLPLHSLYYRDDPGKTHLARSVEHPQMAAMMNGWFWRRPPARPGRLKHTPRVDFEPTRHGKSQA